MKKMSKVSVAATAAVLLATLTACGSGSGGSGTDGASSAASQGTAAGSGKAADMHFVNVVKIVGVGWFDRMEEGVADFAKKTGIDATQTGGDDASPEKQVKVITDLLAQNPTAIGVVPNSPEALETVLAKAQAQGIKVVSHEASNLKNMDADIEAFDNKDYGSQMMDELATCMGGKGQYVAFVGSLTAQTHMQWVDGALGQAKAKYPDIKRAVDPIESQENEQTAYEKTKEILASHPEVTGFQGSAGTDVAGVARAIEEAGLADKTCVVGTSIPSVAGKYLKAGSIDKIMFWDPARAGEAIMTVAQLLAEGKTITSGTDLGIEGYNSLKVSPDNPKVFFGDASIVADMSNLDKYPF